LPSIGSAAAAHSAQVVGLPSIVNSIDFDLESDSFRDFGPAKGRTPMCQD
jgi:hypothetical protein